MSMNQRIKKIEQAMATKRYININTTLAAPMVYSLMMALFLLLIGWDKPAIWTSFGGWILTFLALGTKMELIDVIMDDRINAQFKMLRNVGIAENIKEMVKTDSKHKKTTTQENE